MTHRTPEALARWLATTPRPRADHGAVRALVTRGPEESRDRPSSVELEPGRPVPGDRWTARKDPAGDSQLTMMEWGFGVFVAGGEPGVDAFGDNLLVDLDLSEPNLPAGSRVQVGQAVLEVTPKPHHGCKKYARRFGVDALKFLGDHRELRLRGIHLRVVLGGRVAVGDPIVVLDRSAR